MTTQVVRKSQMAKKEKKKKRSAVERQQQVKHQPHVVQESLVEALARSQARLAEALLS